jgi:hypothetical protein
MIWFGILFAIDLVAAAMAMFLFVWGLSDGGITSVNMQPWLFMVAMPLGVLWGGWTLRRGGRTAQANLVLLVLAVPSVGIALPILALFIDVPGGR